jgi:hypothetical protein
MELLEGFPCNRCHGYFSEYFMDPVSIDNGLFVGGLSKTASLQQRAWFPDQEVI